MQGLTKLYIGSDHAAFEMKQLILDYLKSKEIQFEDKGCYSLESCDYPDFAYSVCQSVLSDPNSLGILICGSGVGISIAANKVKGIRCGLCHDYSTVFSARAKDHCNVIAFGARVIGIEVAKQIVDAFLTIQPLDTSDVKRRVEKLALLEKEMFK